MSAQRAWLENDYYGVLGVDKTASAAEVTKAYRKLARKLHPAANPNDPTAEDRFKEVSAAYDVLGDETRRSEYDELRRLGPMGGGFGPGVGGFGSPGGVPFDVGNLGARVPPAHYFGVPALAATDQASFEETFAHALAAPGPTVIEARVDPAHYIDTVFD